MACEDVPGSQRQGFNNERDQMRKIRGEILLSCTAKLTLDRVDPIATAYVCMGERVSAAARNWLTSFFALTPIRNCTGTAARFSNGNYSDTSRPWCDDTVSARRRRVRNVMSVG